MQALKERAELPITFQNVELLVFYPPSNHPLPQKEKKKKPVHLKTFLDLSQPPNYVFKIYLSQREQASTSMGSDRQKEK